MSTQLKSAHQVYFDHLSEMCQIHNKQVDLNVRSSVEISIHTTCAYIQSLGHHLEILVKDLSQEVYELEVVTY